MEQLQKTLLGLMTMCREHLNEIKEHKNLSHLLQNKQVRFITPTGKFDYTTFGNFYFDSMGVMMLVTRDKYTSYRMMDEPVGLWSTVPVIFAGVETGFLDINKEPIFSDDVCTADWCTAKVRFFVDDNTPSLAGDNCDLLLKDCTHNIQRVGTIWYDIDPIIFDQRMEEYHGNYSVYGGNDSDKIFGAKNVPQFIKPLNLKPRMPLTYTDIHQVMQGYPYQLCKFTENEVANPHEPIRRLIEIAYAHPETRFIVENFVKEMDLSRETIHNLQVEFSPILSYSIRNLCIPVELMDLYSEMGKGD